MSRNRRTVAALALLASAGVGVAYRRALGAAKVRVGSGSALLDTAHGPIEYAAAGEGAPVLFIHGAGGGFDQGLDFGEPLARAGFRLIAMSRFGYLRTPLPADASASAQADAHAGLLDALGVERSVVIGGSAGAPSALQFALRHSERTAALVLVVPAAYVPRANGAPPLWTPSGLTLVFATALQSDFVFFAAMHLVRSTLVRTLLATPPEVFLRAGAEERARATRILEHILPISARRLGLANDAAVTSRLERYDLEKIAAPTLVVSVRDDLFGTYEAGRYTAEHIRGARFVGYETGGHVWLGHQHELMEEIVAFLRSHE